MYKDEVTIAFADVVMKLKRCTTLPTPHEITAVIPRAEIRKRLYKNGQLVAETETVLNSITISHSPQHSAENNQGNNGELPGEKPDVVWSYRLRK
ncbi:MAG: hypothetical protein ACM3PP_08295 [Candidatus Saccharibacteria bacterium]